MSGLILLIAIVMIAVVVVWSMLNDDSETPSETRWLLAMKDATAQDEEPTNHDVRKSAVHAGEPTRIQSSRADK